MGRGAPCPRATRLRILATCAFKVETKGGGGQRHPRPAPPTRGASRGGIGAQGQWAVPDSGILVPEVVAGGLSVVAAAAAVVVVVAAVVVVVAMVVGATPGMVGTVVASVVAAVAVASVLLTAPVAPTGVGGNVGGAGREM